MRRSAHSKTEHVISMLVIVKLANFIKMDLLEPGVMLPNILCTLLYICLSVVFTGTEKAESHKSF